MSGPEFGVILDVTPGDNEGFERHMLEAMGHPVEVCHGPSGHGCSLVDDGTCQLLERAHGVVFKLDLDRPYHRDILERYRAVVGDATPIAVAVQPGQEEEYSELLDGMYLWNHQPTAAELDGFAARVEAAERVR